jgi:hypothetical protein
LIVVCKPDIQIVVNIWSLGQTEVEESFGLDKERDFFPSSGPKGPIKYLLQ